MTLRTRPMNHLREREITLIHIAKAQLGLDEATYRARVAWESALNTSH